MSFTRQVKGELLRTDVPGSCCSKAELMAMFHMRGTLIKSRSGLALEFITESTATARRLFSLFKKLFDVSPEVLFRHKARLQKNKIFLLRIKDKDKERDKYRGKGECKGECKRKDKQKVQAILKELGLSLPYRETSWQQLRRRCCRKAYIRGAFLAGGSLCNPEANYHLEINCPYSISAQVLKNIFASFQLHAKSFKRKQYFVVYLKESEQIVDFLRVIGAYGMLLDFENVRIMKEMRSQVNRLVNCDTANLDKTVVAAQNQIKNINLIDCHIGLGNIPSLLRCTAELRRLFPEASLRELGEMSNPQISKSGINHRLRRLNAIAGKLMVQ